MGLFTDSLGNPNIYTTKELLEDVGFLDRSIPALLGNIDVETGGTFDWQQKQIQGDGYGLFQFDAMKKPYMDWLKNTGMKDSDKSQAMFVYDSIYADKPFYDIGAGHRRKLREHLKNSDLDTMTKEISERFLRPGKPHLDRRLESARGFKD